MLPSYMETMFATGNEAALPSSQPAGAKPEPDSVSLAPPLTEKRPSPLMLLIDGVPLVRLKMPNNPKSPFIDLKELKRRI